MAVARKGVWTALLAVVSAVGLLAGADSALAETKTFTAQGCEKWEVPAGVSSVAIQATGAAGQIAAGGNPGGNGDGFSAVLSGLSFGEDLFVCVDQGGGAGGSAPEFPGGAGGGASGVSRGSGFESPVLVAAGGGGGGGGLIRGGAGGNAGEAGHDGQLTGSGGGAGTESEAGAGGKGDTAAENGESGAKFTNAGPGRGGAGGNSGSEGADGGGGGGGYYGGGGGGATGGVLGAAGGGGGADFCANGATSCEKHAQAGTKHEAGEAEGDAKVTIVYTLPPKTCGKTTVGKTADPLVANVKRVNKCVVPFNAAVTQLMLYLSPTSFKGQELIKGVIYADNSGKPAALLGFTEQLTFKSTEAAGWYQLKFASPVSVVAGTYWIGVVTGNSGKVAGEHWDTVKSAEDYNTNNYASGPSNPFGSFKTTSEEMSLYATFTSSGKGGG
jgi:hypothetical protein